MSREQQPGKAYPADRTDEQWAIVAPLLPAPRSNRGGRPRELDMCEVLNPLLSLHRSGCQGEMLPHDVLPQSGGSAYCAPWREEGTWSTILAALRERVRRDGGREPTPSAAGLDSHSVKTTEVGGKDRGYDGGKKITGRKRHVRVDPLGLLRAGLSTSAPVDEGAAAATLLAQISAQDFPRLETSLGASQYHKHALAAWVATKRPGGRIEVKARPEDRKGFTPVRKRGVVERTTAWNGRARRTSKDYERKPESAAAMIQVSHLHLLLRKLAPSAQREFHYDAAA